MPRKTKELPPPDPELFGGRLRIAREAAEQRWAGREVSQSEVARASGVEPQRINQVERNPTQELSVTPAIKAAEFLRVRLRWLAMNEGPMELDPNYSDDVPGELAELRQAWDALLPDTRRRLLRQIVRLASRTSAQVSAWAGRKTVAVAHFPAALPKPEKVTTANKAKAKR